MPARFRLTECLGYGRPGDAVLERHHGPAIRSGQRVLVAAHGNSIRALVKYLDNIADDEIVRLNIPNGIPLVYELDDKLQPSATTLSG